MSWLIDNSDSAVQTEITSFFFFFNPNKTVLFTFASMSHLMKLFHLQTFVAMLNV